MRYEDFYRAESPSPGVDANRTAFHVVRGDEDDDGAAEARRARRRR
jgi:hypothetical protein